MNARQDIELAFSSRLAAPPEAVWAWMTSVHGISCELWPWMKMTVPRGVRSLNDLDFTPGKPLFKAWVLLLGILPVDRVALTLLKLDPCTGFIEQSPSCAMALWRHERSLESIENGTRLTDRLTFRPRLARPIVCLLIHHVFTHRHAVLKRRLGEA